MRRWLMFAGLVMLGTIVIAIQQVDVLLDPWAIEVTIERSYHLNGNIACEASRNRRRQLHGWQIIFDQDGRVVSELLYDHDEWVISRIFDYENGLLRVGDGHSTQPHYTVELIPEVYYEYERTEKDPESPVAE